MNTVKAIINISRPINFLITFLSVVIAAQISGYNNLLDIKILTGALSFAFSFSAGNIINDIFDFEIDRINRPNRVLPSGKLSIRFAKYLYIIFLLISINLSTFNGTISILFLILINLVLYFYSSLFQKIIIAGNLVVAALTASALIYGAMISGNIAAGIIPAVFAFLINFVREIIKDTEDIKGDKAVGIVTLPQKSGINFTVKLSVSIVIGIILFTVYPFINDIYGIEYFIIIMALVNPIFVKIIKELINPDANFRNVSSLLKVNMLFGLLAILLGALY